MDEFTTSQNSPDFPDFQNLPKRSTLRSFIEQSNWKPWPIYFHDLLRNHDLPMFFHDFLKDGDFPSRTRPRNAPNSSTSLRCKPWPLQGSEAALQLDQLEICHPQAGGLDHEINFKINGWDAFIKFITSEVDVKFISKSMLNGKLIRSQLTICY
jgi:hypothetical protein